jgi:hypothetical protein
MRTTVLPALAALLSATPLAISAAEDAKPAEGTTAQVDAAQAEKNGKLLEEAEGFAKQGRQSLQSYRRDQAGSPHAVVDAALAFTEAHKRYLELGDQDEIAEMQASIFWCKKQMNLDAVKEYLARKGDAKSAEAALARIDAVADAKVDSSEQQQYFDRAAKYATDHPDDFSGISIRYFEVAERFAGSPVAIEAQRKSLDAQQKYMQWLQSGGLLRETRFTKPNKLESGAKVPMPSDADSKTSLTEFKKLNAARYAKKGDAQKRRLARHFADEAEKNRGDATMYYVIMGEVVRLATEGEDYERLLNAVDALGAAYEGYDAEAQKRTSLKAMKGKAGAGAVVTLLDDPKNASANTIAGRFYCFQLRRWDDGISMLAIGNDQDLKTIAEQEIAGPANDDQRAQLAEAWYAQGKKGAGSAADKNGMLSRAQYWYLKARGLNGVAKEKRTKRLEEIDKVLPLDMDNIDWGALTPNQWSKLKGQECVVQARTARSGPFMTLAAGQRVRIVAHPGDTWSGPTWVGVKTSDFRGLDRIVDTKRNIRFLMTFDGQVDQYSWGCMLYQVGTGPLTEIGIAEGPGTLFLAPNMTGDCKGQIRAKLLPVADDE